jgi:Glycosyl transferase family 2
MMAVGIAIITHERRSLLERLTASVAELTSGPHELVVADDGSLDGSAKWCRDHGLRVVSGVRRGVAWNKNRALFALAHLGCDPLVLLEDDALPVVRGWERDWIEGTGAWHHVACDPKVLRHAVSGAGTPADPYISPAATGFCMSVSTEVLELVGYFDSRFRGYGHEHAEWTTRIKRAGYGFSEITLPDGRRFKAQLFLTGGLTLVKAESTCVAAEAHANRELGKQIAGEPVFRRPWRTPEERGSFLAEQASAEIDGRSLAARLDTHWRQVESPGHSTAKEDTAPRKACSPTGISP